MLIKTIRKYLTFFQAYNRGRTQEILGDYNLAYRAFLYAIAIKSDFIEINNALIRNARKTRKYWEATDFLDTAIRKFPEHADFYAQKADLYRLLKEYDKAIEMYDKALEKDGENIDYYEFRAKIKYCLNNTQDALYDYNSAVQKSPRNAKLYAQRAFYNMERKNYKSSIEDYTSAIKLNPEKAHYYYMRAAVKILNGEFDTASEDIKIAKKGLGALAEELFSVEKMQYTEFADKKAILRGN